ncbi:hypothetical protein GCM10022222_05130 [Amycolatopsis ultiminotia]|uniref:Uncharacterized protein n=1 Tax=Amycolatopsis ultiminotia TaxID=543629 RepID=A0ABP6V1K0_9PSEU
MRRVPRTADRAVELVLTTAGRQDPGAVAGRQDPGAVAGRQDPGGFPADATAAAGGERGPIVQVADPGRGPVRWGGGAGQRPPDGSVDAPTTAQSFSPRAPPVDVVPVLH